jgi:hypothetical protein
MILTQLGHLWHSLHSWWTSRSDDTSVSLPHPQWLILIALERHLKSTNPHLDDLLSPEALYDRLSPYARGEWYQFVADLEALQDKLFLIFEDDRIILSPRGSYIASEYERQRS